VKRMPVLDEEKQRAEWREATAKGARAVSELLIRKLTEDPEALSGVLIIFGVPKKDGAPDEKDHYGGWWAEEHHVGCFADYLDDLRGNPSVRPESPDAKRMFV
jgi:hypothetical protein